MPRRPLTPVERTSARIVTGPLGHFWGGALDWAEALGRFAWARARGRQPW